MHCRLFIAAAITMLASTLSTYAQQPTSKDQLIGTWRVTALKATNNAS